MKILITGKSSYIGNSFFDWAKEHEPLFEVSRISLRNNELNNISFKGYDVVFHVAGIAHINSNKKLIPEYYRVNRDLAIDSAIKAKNEGVKQFIFTSSIAIYGRDYEINALKPIKEDEPRPINAYGQSKFDADLAIQKLNDVHFNTVILRIPLVYGLNAKGNLLKLMKLAILNPFYPKIENIRSVLNINNLNLLLSKIIHYNKAGVYYPQDSEYFNTNNFIKLVRTKLGKNVFFFNFLNFIFNSLACISEIPTKIYGNKFYNKSLSKVDFVDYNIFNVKSFIDDYFNR
jgi:UDP-glucose 4-epimerase